MPRLGKKTLYLDLDALEKLENALQRFPGRPSLSSFLSEQLPTMADQIHRMADALQAGGIQGAAHLLGSVADAQKQLVELQEGIKDTLLTTENKDLEASEPVADVPPKKPRKSRAKKVAKE